MRRAYQRKVPYWTGRYHHNVSLNVTRRHTLVFQNRPKPKTPNQLLLHVSSTVNHRSRLAVSLQVAFAWPTHSFPKVNAERPSHLYSQTKSILPATLPPWFCRASNRRISCATRWATELQLSCNRIARLIIPCPTPAGSDTIQAQPCDHEPRLYTRSSFAEPQLPPGDDHLQKLKVVFIPVPPQ